MHRLVPGLQTCLPLLELPPLPGSALLESAKLQVGTGVAWKLETLCSILSLSLGSSEFKITLELALQRDFQSSF